MTSRNEFDKPLLGKVALIINGVEGEGRALALSMADYGADIALVFSPDEHEKAEEIQQVIEGKDRHCLLIVYDQEGDEKDKRDLFSEVVDHFGHMDFFINYSLYKKRKNRPENDQQNGSGDLNFDILSTIFSQVKYSSEQAESAS